MSKIGLFYGSDTSHTESVAYDIYDTIVARLGEDVIDIHKVGSVELQDMLRYDYLILGIPTWDIGELQADWDIKWEAFKTLDLTGRKVAVFGLGDQYGYPDTFLDAAGILAETVLVQGGELVGYTPSTGYQFEESLFLEGDRFMGLALDEDHQPELTKARVDTWIPQLLSAFELAHVEKALS